MSIDYDFDHRAEREHDHIMRSLKEFHTEILSQDPFEGDEALSNAVFQCVKDYIAGKAQSPQERAIGSSLHEKVIKAAERMAERRAA